MCNLSPQEGTLDNIKRFKKDVRTPLDVSGGDVHLSIHNHPSKYRAPGHVVMGRRVRAGGTAQEDWETGVRASSDTGH